MEGSEGDSDITMSFMRQDFSDDMMDSSDREKELLREQDRFLPIANVARIMKKSIPKAGKIAKDARECVQECVSEFISFITSEASDRCHQEKRKTINGEDILWAMNNLGFENYVEPLKLYLQKFREATKGDTKGEGGIGPNDYELNYNSGIAFVNTSEEVNQGDVVCNYPVGAQVQQFTLG